VASTTKQLLSSQQLDYRYCRRSSHADIQDETGTTPLDDHRTVPPALSRSPPGPNQHCAIELMVARLLDCFWYSFLHTNFTELDSRSRSAWAVVRLPACLSSLTLLCPIQPVEIFSNISTPFSTLAICWLPRKIRRSSKRNPTVRRGGDKRKRGSSNFRPVEGYISEKVQNEES